MKNQKNVNEMSSKELKDSAKKNKITGWWKMNKTQLIAALSDTKIEKEENVADTKIEESAIDKLKKILPAKFPYQLNSRIVLKPIQNKEPEKPVDNVLVENAEKENTPAKIIDADWTKKYNIQPGDIVFLIPDQKFGEFQSFGKRHDRLWSQMWKKNSLKPMSRKWALLGNEIEIAFKKVDGKYVNQNPEKFDMKDNIPVLKEKSKEVKEQTPVLQTA